MGLENYNYLQTSLSEWNTIQLLRWYIYIVRKDLGIQNFAKSLLTLTESIQSEKRSLILLQIQGNLNQTWLFQIYSYTSENRCLILIDPILVKPKSLYLFWKLHIFRVMSIYIDIGFLALLRLVRSKSDT